MSNLQLGRIKSKRRIFVFLASLCWLWVGVFATGCKSKVYVLPGVLEAHEHVKKCEIFKKLPDFLSIHNAINILISDSLETNDPTDLELINDRLRAEINIIRKFLTPELTNGLYPVTYTWHIVDKDLKDRSRLVPKVIEIDGTLAKFGDFKTLPTYNGVDITVERMASALEVCSLQSTVQALFSVETTPGKPDYYLRLIMAGEGN